MSCATIAAVSRGPFPPAEKSDRGFEILKFLAILSAVSIGLGTALSPVTAQLSIACGEPSAGAIAAAFDLTANGISHPASAVNAGSVDTVPPSLLDAVGWVESGWRQYTPSDIPVVSASFGYGIMQITSGMPGAYGKAHGSVSPGEASRIASDYRYNISYGMRVLIAKWLATPAIGNRDPTVLEDWYYGLWAYNGWGWENNPNNPRFSRAGNPASDPTNFPYQERVLYLVSHPPIDSDGNPLWPAVPVTLPSRKTIGRTPHSFTPSRQHRQTPPSLSAVYQPAPLGPVTVGSTQSVRVQLINTGLQPWPAGDASGFNLTYHLLNSRANILKTVSPHSRGVIAFGQHPVPMPRTVPPGGSVTISTQIRVPESIGTYSVVWDLQTASSTWLSELGSPARAVRLHAVAVGSNTPAATPEPVAAAAVPKEDLEYVADTSVPDGSSVASAEPLTKGWLVYNGGRGPWTRGWKLKQVAGPSFHERTIPVPSTLPCRTANILATLHAPSRVGRSSAAWRLRDPEGHLVGQRLTVVVRVTGSGSPGSAPTPTPSSVPPKPAPSPTPTPIG